MALQDVTASTLLDVQAKFGEMFTAGPVMNQYKEQANTAAALMANNAAKTAPIIVNGVCTGQQVMFTERGNDTVSYDGDGTGLALSCDLPVCNGAKSNVKNYADNLKIVSCVEVDDNLCDNVYDFAALASERLKTAIADVRRRLNIRSINFLDTVKGISTDPEHPDGVAAPDGITYTNATKTFTAAGVLFSDPDFLANIDALAMNNDIDSYFMVSGRWNFWNANRNAQYYRQNDDGKQYGAFDEYRMHFDAKSLDATLTGKNTFVVGDGSFAVWNRVWSTPTPTEIKDGSFEYHIFDPELMIKQNGVLQPVKYEVYYQKICSGANANGKRTFTHRFEVKYFGGLVEAPVAILDKTDVLKITQA